MLLPEVVGTWAVEQGPRKWEAALDQGNKLLQLGLDRTWGCKKPRKNHTVNFADDHREIRCGARENAIVPFSLNGPTDSVDKKISHGFMTRNPIQHPRGPQLLQGCGSWRNSEGHMEVCPNLGRKGATYHKMIHIFAGCMAKDTGTSGDLVTFSTGLIFYSKDFIKKS